MKRILFSLLLPVLFVAGNAASAQTVIANDGAELTLASETIDLGEMTKDSFYYHTLNFTNTGNEPLIISRAQGSCGCTVPDWPKQPINAGESEAIKIKFHARSAGPVNKQVTIYSNAKNGATLVVRVKGRVNAPMAGGTAPVKVKPAAPRVKDVNDR